MKDWLLDRWFALVGVTAVIGVGIVLWGPMGELFRSAAEKRGWPEEILEMMLKLLPYVYIATMAIVVGVYLSCAISAERDRSVKCPSCEGYEIEDLGHEYQCAYCFVTFEKRG